MYTVAVRYNPATKAFDVYVDSRLASKGYPTLLGVGKDWGIRALQNHDDLIRSDLQMYEDMMSAIRLIESL